MTFQMDETIVVRLRHQEKHEVIDLVKEHSDRYDSPSHFARCAIIRLLREEKAQE